MQRSPWNFPRCTFCNRKIILRSDRKRIHRTAFSALSKEEKKKKKKRSQGVPDVSAWHTTVPSTSLSLKKPAGCDVWSCITELMSPLWVSLSLPCQPSASQPSSGARARPHDDSRERDGSPSRAAHDSSLPDRYRDMGLGVTNIRLICRSGLACMLHVRLMMCSWTHRHTHTSPRI